MRGFILECINAISDVNSPLEDNQSSTLVPRSVQDLTNTPTKFSSPLVIGGFNWSTYSQITQIQLRIWMNQTL